MPKLYRTLFFVALGVALIASIYSSPLFEKPPKTAKEFIKRYAQAYEREDVPTILKMTLRDKDASEDTLKMVIENDIKRRAFNYVAWTHTRYESEADHGKYIYVDVTVDEASSAIVLVRADDGTLKITQNPGDYEK